MPVIEEVVEDEPAAAKPPANEAPEAASGRAGGREGGQGEKGGQGGGGGGGAGADAGAGGEAGGGAGVGEAEAAPLTPAEEAAQRERLEAAAALKAQGNELFGAHDYDGAALRYTEAIEAAPEGHRDRAVFYNNRATCFFKLGQHDRVIADCSAALKLDPDYAKCLLRRAQAYESQKKVCEAHDDFQRVLKLDASNSIAAAACKRLEKPAAEEREKQKEEMIGKLKDLGNTVLGKFGMSLDSFKAVQDPNTGSYSISYNPGGN